jgi:hypothetical protein
VGQRREDLLVAQDLLALRQRGVVVAHPAEGDDQSDER